MWVTLNHADGYRLRVNLDNVAYFQEEGDDRTVISFSSPGGDCMRITVLASFDELNALLETRLRNR